MFERNIERLLKVLLNPQIAVKHIWRRIPVGSIELREKFDAFTRPSYAWGVINAAKLARNLGHKSVSVIEFGVAEGYGLMDMEKTAMAAEKNMALRSRCMASMSAPGMSCRTILETCLIIGTPELTT